MNKDNKSNLLADVDKELELLDVDLLTADIFGVEMDYIDDFEFARYRESGCTAHTNTGCSNHTNYSQSNHSNSGYSNHTNSGYSNHSNTGYKQAHTNTGCNDTSYYGNSIYREGDIHSQSGYNNWSNSYYNNWSNCGVNGCGKGCKTSGSGCSNASSYYQCGNYYYSEYSEVGYKNHTNSGYNNHSQSGCSNHTNSGYNNHTNSGCSNYSTTGYNNWSNTGYNNHTNYKDNNPPTLSGAVAPASGTFDRTINLSWTGASDVTIPGQPAETKYTYNLHYRHKVNSTAPWTWWPGIASVTTGTTYTWDCSAIPNGIVQVAVFAFDGIEWSGSWNTTTGELYGSYAITPELTIAHYQAPAWTNVIEDGKTIIKKIDHDELRREINKARVAFGLAPKTFTGGETAAANSELRVVHMTEMRTAVNEAATAAGRPQKAFSQGNITNVTNIKGIDTREIREAIESLD